MSRHLTYVAILGAVLAGSAHAADYSWQAASGDWSIASNWGGSVPPSGVIAYIVNGGTATVASSGAACGSLVLGTSAGSGTVQMLSGNLLSSAAESIGLRGTGVFVQSGGTNSVSGGGDIYVGAFGSGSYSLSGSGLLVVGQDLTLADDSGGNGSFSLSESGRISAKSEVLSNGGAATFTQSGGTNACGSLLFAGGASGTGTYNMNGGLLTVSSFSVLNRNATFNFNGGTLQVTGSLSIGLPMMLGTSGGGATFDSSGYSLTLSSLLSGPGSLTKIGSGTLLLAGSNTYMGATAIDQGKLTVNGPLASPVTVADGGELSGTGGLTSVTVNAGGHLAPGGAPGVLQLSGSLSLLPGAALDYELGTPAGSDLILMPSGALALSGQQFADFAFTPLAGFGPGDYTLIDAGSISGGLGANVGGTIDGLPATLAIQGNDVVLHVVPEPSTLALLASGCFGWLGFRLLGLRWPKRRRACLHSVGGEPLESWL